MALPGKTRKKLRGLIRYLYFESKSFKVLSTLRQRSNFITTVGLPSCHTEFKITTTATATGTSLNKRFNEQNNGSARAL